MSGWGLQGIFDVNVPNSVNSFAPLEQFFDVWFEILSCVFLEDSHTSRFDHVDNCCSIQYNAIHSHIIGCGFLIEFFKAMQEVWLWSRHQVTIFGSRWRITAILVWKELIEVAISNLTSDVKSREMLTWLLKCCSFLSGLRKIHWAVLPLIQQLSWYCQLHFDLEYSSSPVLLGLSILLRKDFLLPGTLRLNHWHSLKITFVHLVFVHGVLSVLIMMLPSCKAMMLRNLSHFSPLQVHKLSNVVTE